MPPVPLHALGPGDPHLVRSLSCLLRSLVHVDWLVRALADAVRAVLRRPDEPGARERWLDAASAPSGDLVRRLSALHRSSLREACRARAEPGFDARDARRGRGADPPLAYRMRIVCQEGAIVRDGIEIDRCDNVGNLEMGEIVHAYGAFLCRG